MPTPSGFSYSAADESPGFLLWQMTNLWQRRMREALEPLGLTHVQFVLLAGVAWLTEQGESVSQARLAAHARTDVMMTSQVVRTLAEKGLLVRAPDPGDARARRLALTPEGARLIGQAVGVVEEVDRRFFGAGAPHDVSAQFVELARVLLAAEALPTPPRESV